MADFLIRVSLEKEGEFTMPSPKAKKAYRGRDRQRIRGLLAVLNQIEAMDVRNAARATANGTPAINFAVTQGANLAGAITNLKARCTSALTQTVSVQPNNAQDRA